MSRQHKPWVAVIAIGLALIALLFTGRVWSQATYDHFIYVPLIARSAPTPTPTSWIYCRLGGKVMTAATPSVPISGAVVSYSLFSRVYPGRSDITVTASNGHYGFAGFDTHDTDLIRIQAQATGYAPQVHADNAIMMCLSSGSSNFALVTVTPTPTPCPSCP